MLEAQRLEQIVTEQEKRIEKLEQCISSIKAELRINTMITIAILTALLSLIVKVI